MIPGEFSLHAEVMLAEPVGRFRWAASHLVFALTGFALMRLGRVIVPPRLLLSLCRFGRFGWRRNVDAFMHVVVRFLLLGLLVVVDQRRPRLAHHFGGLIGRHLHLVVVRVCRQRPRLLLAVARRPGWRLVRESGVVGIGGGCLCCYPRRDFTGNLDLGAALDKVLRHGNDDFGLVRLARPALRPPRARGRRG